MYLSQMSDKYDAYTEPTPTIYETDINNNNNNNNLFTP